MKNFKLVSQSNSKNVNYIYKSEDMMIIFHSHPTKAFNYVCTYASANVTQKIYNNLINSFVKQGIAQHDYKGGFNEAISILTF